MAATEADDPSSTPPQGAAPQAAERESAEPVAARSSLRTIPSTELLQGEREVVIVHHGEQYRLRLTRNDRLVLYK